MTNHVSWSCIILCPWNFHWISFILSSKLDICYLEGKKRFQFEYYVNGDHSMKIKKNENLDIP